MKETIFLIVGLLIVLGVAALFAVLTCKSKNRDLFKWVGIAFFVAFFLTWVIPYGYFNGTMYTEYGLSRLGISDVPTIGYYAVYFCLTTVLYLLVVGGFYGVVSKTDSYKNLVNKFAKTVEKNKILFAILTMVITILLSSLLKSSLVLLVFAPFMASVFLNAKTDKVTTMGITFGSILVGLLAATFGTDSLTWFNSYVGTDVKVGMLLRGIIGGTSSLLFVGYNILRLVKENKNANKPKKRGRKAAKEVETEKESIVDSLFAVETNDKPGRCWTTIVLLSVLFVFVILAYVNWSGNFGIECFNSFHQWLTELTLGKDFTIFGYILGANATAFGAMEITSLLDFLLIVVVIYALMEGISVKDFMANFGEGFTKMFKPVCLYVLTYSVFIVMYMSPIMACVTNWVVGLTKNFNPYLQTVNAFVNNIFTADLGYSGYLVGTALNGLYPENFDIIHTIFVETYGLVQLFMPTGGVLLIGLAYFDIDYKTWFKYIWMFAVAVVVVLLVVATFATYVF